MHFEPSVIFSVFGIPVHNTIFTTLVVDALLIGMIYLIYKNRKMVPGKLQLIFELIVGYFYNLTKQIAGSRADTIFPWFATFFFFIFFSNILGLFPGFGTIGLIHHTDHGNEIVPLLRPPTSDFNATLALATVSLVATHVIAIRSTGLADYLSRFFSLNPIYLFVGILELVSEVTKLFSLSFRLFGNIFAGEVVLHTVAKISAFVAPIPFLLLESIVALVQALVFAMLTMVFMSILSTPHHAEKH